MSLEDKLSQPLYRESGETEACRPGRRLTWLPGVARGEHAGFGVTGPSVRGQALVWMPRGRAFTSSPVLCHFGYGRSYFPPLEEAQRRTGAEGGRWCPVDWLGKLRVSRSPFPAEMTRLAGAFLPHRPPLTPAGCT